MDIDIASVEPYNNRILVEVDPPESISSSGLVIPDTAQSKNATGVVVACSHPVSYWEEAGITEGTRILYHMFAGTELKEGSKWYVILCKEDIIAKIVEKPRKEDNNDNTK